MEHEKVLSEFRDSKGNAIEKGSKVVLSDEGIKFFTDNPTWPPADFYNGKTEGFQLKDFQGTVDGFSADGIAIVKDVNTNDESGITQIQMNHLTFVSE